MSGWVLIIPPSESKSCGAKGSTFAETRKSRKTNSFPDLDEPRTVLINYLQALIERGQAMDRIFEANGTALTEAVAWNRALLNAPVIPARDLYTGVMYKAIDYKTLAAREKKLFDQQTLIVSGLFGLLRPSDLVPPYKLKISANLGGLVGKLPNYWRRPVSELLRREVRGKVVWDFLPDQHRRVWDNTGEVAARHQVKFVKRIIRSGVAEFKTISHHSKALKGALIRHLLKKNAETPKDLHDFVHEDGYVYNRELSVTSRRESILVFAAE